MSDEGYAFFWWDRRRGTTCAEQPCRICYALWKALHKVIPAPAPPAPPAPPKRTYVGWFVPNSVELVYTLRSIQKAPGKRIHVEVLDNGPIRFYAEEV